MVFSLRKVHSLTKAFDAVNWETLLVILINLGCPWKFIQFIWLFHNGMIGLILSSGDTSTPSDISKGVWSRAVFWFLSFATCSSLTYWIMYCMTLPVQYTWGISIHEAQTRWLTIWLQMAEWKDQDSWETHHGGFVCWCLCSHGILRAWTSNHQKQICQSLSPLWSHNQSQQGVGYAKACSRVNNNSSQHKHRWHSAETRWPLQVSGKCNLFWWHSQQG